MKEKFEGLLYTPASDPNFLSGIQRLKDAQLNALLERLTELNETESGHKGRIKAVEKELKIRGGSSTEMIAVDKMKNEIETVERLYGDGMPYDKDRLEDAAKFYLAQTAQSLFESGKIFLRLKAHEGHGGFMESLTRIGVPQTTANYAMAVVLKFGSNSPALGNLGSTKLKMLSVLDEPDIKALVKDGVTGSLILDDIGRMTTRELREKLREEREKHKKDVDTREKAIKQKEVKINELDEQLRNRLPPTPEQIAQAALQELTLKFTGTLAHINTYLREAYATVVKAEKIENVNVQQLSDWLGQFYDNEIKTFRELSEAWLNEIDNAGPMQDWRISDLPK